MSSLAFIFFPKTVVKEPSLNIYKRNRKKNYKTLQKLHKQAKDGSYPTPLTFEVVVFLLWPLPPPVRYPVRAQICELVKINKIR